MNTPQDCLFLFLFLLFYFILTITPTRFRLRPGLTALSLSSYLIFFITCTTLDLLSFFCLAVSGTAYIFTSMDIGVPPPWMDCRIWLFPFSVFCFVSFPSTYLIWTLPSRPFGLVLALAQYGVSIKTLPLSFQSE